MKMLTKMMVSLAAAAAALSCGPKKEAQKVLVLYYSQNGNTKAVADEIADRLGADLEEIVALQPYDGDFQATIGRCLEERENGTLPVIQPLQANLNAYDVIFLGYPVWFGTYAPPVISLLNQVDLSGKKVVPFCSFGSGGLDSSTRDLIAAQPDAEVLPGYGVRAARIAAIGKEVDYFLKSNGFLEGEFVQLEEFPEQHVVTEDEAAIFDAAVDGYPMLHAQAKSVASRSVPDGVEYLFTALDQPREEGAPARELKVYVLAEEGQAPVFTQVLR